MRITPTGPRPAAVERPGGVRKAGAGFAPAAGDRPAAAAAGAGPAAPLTSLAALIAAQEVPGVDADGRRDRAARRGHGLLDRLDELRLALLEGRLPEPALRRLAALLGEQVEAAADDDPRLAAVLAEIELRAAVELAKLERG